MWKCDYCDDPVTISIPSDQGGCIAFLLIQCVGHQNAVTIATAAVGVKATNGNNNHSDALRGLSRVTLVAVYGGLYGGQGLRGLAGVAAISLESVWARRLPRKCHPE